MDQSEAMGPVARERGGAAHARGAREPRAGYERIFTSHFYGHLEAEQRAAFKALPAAEKIVVDSALRPGAPAAHWQGRPLTAASRHRVYKRWFAPETLAAELGGEVLYAGPWFVAVS